jgi:hypothetical protein
MTLLALQQRLGDLSRDLIQIFGDIDVDSLMDRMRHRECRAA